MIVVFHTSAKDIHLAFKNIELAKVLDGKVDFDCVLAADTLTPRTDELEEKCNEYFRSVSVLRFEPPFDNNWPAPANWCWQHVARHMMDLKQAWFWWEMDAVPLRSRWLQTLCDEYERANKGWMGHIVEGMGHMNGVGIYHPDTPAKAITAMITRKNPWDVAMRHDTIQHTHAANHLIAHCWNINGKGEITNRVDPDCHAATFKSWDDVERWVDFNCVIFHRAKDGTLHDLLIEHGGVQTVTPNVVSFTQPTTPDEPEIEAVVTQEPEDAQSWEPLKVGILYVTHEADLSWLTYSLASYEKYCKGFSSITVVVPEHQRAKFKLVEMIPKTTLKTFKEKSGKGFLQHEIAILEADKYVPPDTKYVLHLDPDCIWAKDTTPFHYFNGDALPDYVVRTYDSLKDDEKKVHSDCYQWRAAVQKALGYEPKWYTMCRHPTIFPIDLYDPLRVFITKAVGKSYSSFIMAQKNSFPQGFAEFPTMGAWAIEHAGNRFNWIDSSNGIAPKDRLRVYWSHGGLTQKLSKNKTAEDEIIEILRLSDGKCVRKFLESYGHSEATIRHICGEK